MMDSEAWYGVWYKMSASTTPILSTCSLRAATNSHVDQKSDANFCEELSVPDPVDKQPHSFETL